MAGTLIIFDFDETIIDCESDDWVVDELGATEVFHSLLHTMPWNSLMDRMMREIQGQGRTIEDIAEVLRRVSLDPHVVSAIRTSSALGCDLRVVSDANAFFIEAIVERHGIMECFTEIITNPSYVDDEGRLRISPYHNYAKSSHGCPICPPNMCKSKIMERIRAEGAKRVIYLGDGKGDYCPSLQLEYGDSVMPRKNYPLCYLIQDDPSLLKAGIHEWSNGADMEWVLLELVKRTDLSSNASVACKMETNNVPSRAGLPKALQIA
ncbi:hypothetical protein HPP92_027898 [Vanilla planifolia]|uniref:Uncharacterized protein n=1 Tax=Vanilla planifolia TaxID=51239 RepID=A0A835PA11_VANPL|nr:hypothetical protein HPP92_027898 [Vanilla planifolia]KAG0448406.1 hypothetical protein HPP92_027849 [Vanilla planifolia]